MQGEPRFTLTTHAEKVITERGILLEWVGRVLITPETTEPDRRDPALRHALARIVEHEGRMLRVVYHAMSEPKRVVTAYFDRKQRGARP